MDLASVAPGSAARRLRPVALASGAPGSVVPVPGLVAPRLVVGRASVDRASVDRRRRRHCSASHSCRVVRHRSDGRRPRNSRSTRSSNPAARGHCEVLEATREPLLADCAPAVAASSSASPVRCPSRIVRATPDRLLGGRWIGVGGRAASLAPAGYVFREPATAATGTH